MAQKSNLTSGFIVHVAHAGGEGSAAIAGTELGKPTQKKAETSRPHSKVGNDMSDN